MIPKNSINKNSINPMLLEVSKNIDKNSNDYSIKAEFADNEKYLMCNFKNDKCIVTVGKFIKGIFSLASKNKTIKYNININPAFAKTVSEVINGLLLYKAFITKKVKINGYLLFKDLSIDESLKKEIENLKLVIEAWEKIRAVEGALNVIFDPSVIVQKDESEIIQKIYKSFVLKEPYVESVIINEVTAVVAESMDLNSLKDKGELGFKTLRKVEFSLWKNNFMFYEAVGLSGMHVVSCKKIEKKGSDSIKIVMEIDPKFKESMKQVSILFYKEEEANEYIEKDTNILLNKKKEF